MTQKHWLAAMAIVMAVVAVSHRHARAADSPLKGAWRVVERTAAGPGGPTATPQVGLIIFTDRHYSVMVVDTDRTRPIIGDPSKATIEDFRGAWQGWGANSGTYEVSGQQFTKRALASKSPAQMRPDVFETWDFTIDKDTLVMTLRATDRGPTATGGSVKLVRAE